jgi:PAS domain S-box-containing protein
LQTELCETKKLGKIMGRNHPSKRANGSDALRLSELSYRRLFEAAQDGILILDADTGRVTDVNPFLIKLLGFSHRQMVGKTVGELSPFKDIVSNEAMLELLQKEGYVRYEDLPLETKDGRHIAVEFVSNVYQAGEKKVIQCNIRDITVRKQTESALIRLGAIVEASDDAIMGKDLNGIITNWNQGAKKIFGYTARKMVGTSIMRLIPADRPDEENQILEKIKRGESVEHLETVRRAKDGRLINVLVTVSPIKDATGKVTGASKVAHDITARKKSEQQLNLLNTCIANLNEIVLITEAEPINKPGPKIVFVNAAFERITGYTPAEALGRSPRFLQGKNTDRKVLAEIRKALAQQKPIRRQMINYKKDGAEYWMDIDIVPIFDAAGKCTHFAAIERDITEEKKHDARFRLLVDSNAQGVFFWNTNGEISDANDAFLKLVGYNREDLAAGRVNWIALTPPKYVEQDRRALKELAATGICATYEKEYIRKNGSRVLVLVGSATFADNRDEGVRFVIDLTERKKLEQQFLRAQRMESIGTLAGGIAHDLNNILAPIMMSIQVLKDKTFDTQAKNILETIEASAGRGADVVRQVLSFARGLEGERIAIQPKHLLNELTNIIRDTFPRNIHLQFSIPNNTWMILGDPTQVHQILLNLSLNARDAMPNGGTLTITAENSVLDEHYAAMNLQAKAGRYVQISVTDSGTGMPPEVLDKIFEPFFTTKEIGKGTGLGLSTVMAIVKSHEGFINVYSELGKGTTFKVYLLAMDTASKRQKKGPGKASLPRGNGETILVVDDEASILTITRQTLEAFGYRVLTATDGAEAVAVFSENKRKIAVVLTDMSMPIMDGAAVIRALTKISPKVKIIAASGLSANVGVTKSAYGKVSHFLTKPYTAETLLKSLRVILDEI